MNQIENRIYLVELSMTLPRWVTAIALLLFEKNQYRQDQKERGQPKDITLRFICPVILSVMLCCVQSFVACHLRFSNFDPVASIPGAQGRLDTHAMARLWPPRSLSNIQYPNYSSTRLAISSAYFYGHSPITKSPPKEKKVGDWTKVGCYLLDVIT